MRRKDREVTEFNEIVKIMSNCKVCRIAVNDCEFPYIVPLNFGFDADVSADSDSVITLYFHAAKVGKKIDLFEKNPLVCYEMDTLVNLKEGDIACKSGANYESIIGNGEVIFISDKAEKIHALNKVMENAFGNENKKEYDYPDKMLEVISVFKIESKSFTAKKNSKA